MAEHFVTVGQPGRGIVRREYARALNDRFIRVHNTYVMTSIDAVEEVFERSEPGMPFDVYSRTTLKRVR